MKNSATRNIATILGIRLGEFEVTILVSLPLESLTVVENRERISPYNVREYKSDIPRLQCTSGPRLASGYRSSPRFSQLGWLGGDTFRRAVTFLDNSSRRWLFCCSRTLLCEDMAVVKPDVGTREVGRLDSEMINR
jgi:hypothetical protein